jgi:hypothetical protein
MTKQGVAFLHNPPTRTDTGWMERALCRGDLGFTERSVHAQLAVCGAGCPVKADCLHYAVLGPRLEGEAFDREAGLLRGEVYGAMLPSDLRKLQRGRA